MATQAGSNLSGLKVLLAVSGGVAAYKSVDLASKLTAAGAEVRTILTENGARFVGAKSFEAITRQRVYETLWSTSDEFSSEHISLSDWADIIVVAPATADIIGKIANGICDDLLSTTLCVCWAKPVIIAPAMNANMWANPVVQGNVAKLKQMVFVIVGPDEGRLASGDIGTGRMTEPTEIIQQIDKIAADIDKSGS